MTLTLDPADVADLPWVRALSPVGQPVLARLSTHSSLVAWQVDVAFEEWRIPPELVTRWAEKNTNTDETWRKRPLAVATDSGCPYSCGEVELVARLRKAGFEAWWISEWSGFRHVECWRSFCINRSELRERAPALWEHDQRVRAAASGKGVDLGTRGGHPDVVAWQPGSAWYVFLEYKGPGDEINPKQDRWAQVVTTQEEPRLVYVVVRGRFQSSSIA